MCYIAIMTKHGNSLLAGKLREACNGRLVIPQEVRHQLGIEIGQNVSYRVQNGEMTISTPQEALKKIKKLVKDTSLAGRPIVDELIRERREEAERE